MNGIGAIATVMFAVSVMFGQADPGTIELKNHEYALEYGRFKNYIDGYSFRLDGDFSVDMSLSEVVAVLTSKDTQIEVYKQELKTSNSYTYASYSNGFLSDTVDHHKILAGWKTIGGYRVYVTSWYREKLQRVEDDKNYYVTFDIDLGEYVYSIYIKTAVPFDNARKYYGIVESFRLFEGKEHTTPWSSKTIDVAKRNWNEETLTFYQEYLAGAEGLSWGLYEPKFVTGDFAQVSFYKEKLEYKFPVILCYGNFYKDLGDRPRYLEMGKLLERARLNGHVLELTLQTSNLNDGSNMMYDILQGEYDAFLHYYAQTIAEFGYPVLFRLHNEMNGDWCPYAGYRTAKDTTIFKEVYWYIYGIFEECGANRNTIWVWNPNGRSFPDYDWNHSLMYYPGDEYVDVVGMTAYNTGTYYAEYGEKWREFEVLYADLYHEYCDLFAQPLMITEFSCANMGGDKNRWVEDMFRVIHEYDRIKIAVWWDSCDYDVNGRVSRSYVLDETPELLEIFRKNLAAWTEQVCGDEANLLMPVFAA